MQCSGDVLVKKINGLITLVAEQNDTYKSLALCAVLKRYAGVLALSDKELGRTDLVLHEIDAGDAALIRQKTRPHTLEHGRSSNV